MKDLLLALVLQGLLGCSNASDATTASRNYEPGTREAVKELHGRMLEYGEIDMPVAREAYFMPWRVLPKLHGWLAQGRGLTLWNYGNQQILILDPVPEYVLQEILKITFPDSFNSGLAILQQRFWRQLRKIQNEGLKTGFLIPNPKFLVAGVFYSGSKTIAIDIFANAGVLDHEYRHYQQHLRVDARGRMRPRTLDTDCLIGASQFFGELDATTHEIPTWVGVFPAFEITPAFHKEAKEGRDPVQFPQIGALRSNLGYPGKAYADYVFPTQCPEDLKAAFREIVKETDETQFLLSQDLALQLFGLRVNHFFGWVKLNTICMAEGQSERVRLSCEETRAEIANIPPLAQSTKEKIDGSFPEALTRRQAAIKKALDPLDASYHRDLCRYAAGYEFQYDCRTHLNRK